MSIKNTAEMAGLITNDFSRNSCSEHDAWIYTKSFDRSQGLFLENALELYVRMLLIIFFFYDEIESKMMFTV